MVHDARDIAASLSSGSFKTHGMVILPCSIKTLSGIVHSYTDGLLTRAADVVLKERRPLVLCVRETPLHLGHLRLMTQAAELGAVIMPPMPAFYHRRKACRILSTRRSTGYSTSLILNYPRIYSPVEGCINSAPVWCITKRCASKWGGFVTSITSRTFIRYFPPLMLFPSYQTCYLSIS